MRWTGRALGALCLVALFISTAGLGLLWHLDLPAERRFAARALTGLLSRTFHGKFVVGGIQQLSPRSLAARDVYINDEYGHTVLKVNQLHAEFNVLDLVYRVLLGSDKLSVVVQHVRVEKAEAWLYIDPQTGKPTIQSALTPVPSKSPPSSEARYVRVWLPIIELGEGIAHGQIVQGAPVMQARVTNARGSVFASPAGARVDVPRFGVVLRGSTGPAATGIGSLYFRTPSTVWGSLDGYFGNLQVNGVGRLDGSRASLSVDVPRGKSADLRALWGDWPLSEDAAVHLEASGELPNLYAQASLQVKDSTLLAHGPVDLSKPSARLDVQGNNLDLAVIEPSWVHTHIDATARVMIDQDKVSQAPVVGIQATTQPSEADHNLIPGVELDGALRGGSLQATAHINEPGIPITANLRAGHGTLEIGFRTAPFQAEGAPRLRQHLDAKGQVALEGHAHIEKRELNAQVNGSVRNFQLGEVSLAEGRVNGKITGPLSDPKKLRTELSLQGKDARGSDFRFNDVSAQASGKLDSLDVKVSLKNAAGPNVEASGRLSPQQGAKFEDMQVSVERGGTSVRVRVSAMRVSKRGVEISGLELSGPSGELHGSVALGPDRVSVNARGRDVDLDVLTHILGLQKGVIGGKLNVDADIQGGEHNQHGHLHLALGDATISAVSGVSLRLDAELDGDQLRGESSVLVRNAGSIGSTWDTRLGGLITRVESWRNMIGTAQAQLAGLRLAYLERLLPKGGKVNRIEGAASGELRLMRQSAQALPDLFFVLGTQGLKVAGSDAGEARDGAPGSIQGIDLQMGGSIQGQTGEYTGTTRLIDKTGVLASASGRARLDLKRVLDAPSEFAKELDQAPVEVVLVVGERAIEGLPASLRPQGLSGVLSGRATLTGTLREPSFGASVSIRQLHSAGHELALPVDVTMNAQYQKSSGDLRATAEVWQNGLRVAGLETDGTLKWADLMSGAGSSHYNGKVTLAAKGLPLEVLGPVAEARLSGLLFGAGSLDLTGEAPRLVLDMQLKQASVDRVPVGEGHLTASSEGRALQTQLDLKSVKGTLRARGNAGLTWEGALPQLDQTQPVEVDISAHRFDAAILAPLLTDVLSELSGDVDAQLHASARAFSEPKGPGGLKQTRWSASIGGTAQLRRGTLQIAPLGMQLNDVEFEAQARDSKGETEIVVANLSARTRSEVPNLRGSARLWIKDLRLQRGAATILLNRPVPILIEGVSRATATGRANVALVRQPDEMQVTVDIPELEAKLPRAMRRNVIRLDNNPEVEITQPIAQPTRGRRSEDALPWLVTFKLGRSVKVTRAGLEIPLRGEPQIRFADQITVGGVIELRPGGRVELLGKAFVIESGIIRFDNPDPSNPNLNVTASWRAPDGTLVLVDVRGTFREATLNLRSDPPIADPAVLQALLLGGSSAEAESTPQTVGIGIGTGWLTDLLSDTPLSGIEFRTASEQTAVHSAYSTYTAAIRLSEEVWFEGSYKRAQSDVVGQQNAFSGTIDWRFKPNWSVRTEAGDVGTKLDLLWRYRY